MLTFERDNRVQRTCKAVGNVSNNFQCFSLSLGACHLERSGATTRIASFRRCHHKTFLGCLNCSPFDSGSICNQSGPNGSEFSSYSIWNRFSNFGNALSSYSPWNQYSNAGPIIVDKDGHFYGQLTANRFAIDRTQIQRLNQLTDMVVDVGELEVVRNRFCRQ
jgi:hypothetical protein